MKDEIAVLDKTFEAFVEDLVCESDRASVILGAAKLDILLGQVLRRRLLPISSSRDELFDPEQPLSSFGAKIHLAYRLALIDAEFARSLHLIRRIRNAFAHETNSASLVTDPHLDRLLELITPFKQHKFFNAMSETYYKTLPPQVAVSRMRLQRWRGAFSGCSEASPRSTLRTQRASFRGPCLRIRGLLRSHNRPRHLVRRAIRTGLAPLAAERGIVAPPSIS